MPDERPYQTMTDGDGTTWIEIASAGNSDEAELMQGFLESEGIRATIEHAETTTFPATFGKLGDVRLYVPAADKERALAMLSEREREYEDSVDDDDETLVTDEGVTAIDENAEAETE